MTVSLAEVKGGPVLVTGASGFVGRAVLSELVGIGRRAVGISRKSGTHAVNGVEWHSLDLLTGDIAALLERTWPSAIIHCAGQGGEPRDAAARKASWCANVEVTRRLLEAVAEQSDAPRVVCVSSAAIYAPMPSGLDAQDEENPWRPSGMYGAAKASATMLADVMMRRSMAPIVIAVPFNVIGPGQPAHQVPQDFIQRLQADPDTLSVGDLSAVRDWVDVRDVARALVALTRPEVPSGIYNIATGQGETVRALLDQAIAAMGIAPKVESSAAKVAQSGVSRSIGNPAKLVEATGWQPKYRLDETLRDMLTGQDFL